jgi:hypothetical protein
LFSGPARLELPHLSEKTKHEGVVNTSDKPQDVVMLVDIANVMGSRPDGWWHDRPAAATRLLNGLEPLHGAEVALPDGLGTVRISDVRAVVEGAAKRAEGPQGVSVLRADRDGDSEIVEEANWSRVAEPPPRTLDAEVLEVDGLLLGLRRSPSRSTIKFVDLGGWRFGPEPAVEDQ